MTPAFASVSSGRRAALVVGVANGRSLGWAAARSLLSRGYDVAVTYQSDRFRKGVEALVQAEDEALRSAGTAADGGGGGPSIDCVPCDVSCDDSVRALFAERLPALWEVGTGRPRRLDALVHSVAHASADAMKDGTLLSTERGDFSAAHDISSYSLLLLARHGLPLLSAGGASAPSCASSSSITALTYLGSTRAVPNYNVMGPAKASLEAIVRGLALELGVDAHRVRANAVSAGPVGTLAARGIRGFTDMRAEAEARSAIGRNVTAEEVAEAVAFLAGAEGITGQILFVDGGYSAVAGPVVR